MGDLAIAICLLGYRRLFEPVQRGFARYWLAPLTPCLQFACQRRHYRIAAQLIVIAQILVAQRNADNALHHQGLDRVLNQFRIAPILKARCYSFGEPEHIIDIPQKERTCVRANPPAVEIRRHFP
jgi:hypothetical protein